VHSPRPHSVAPLAQGARNKLLELYPLIAAPSEVDRYWNVAAKPKKSSASLVVSTLAGKDLE
jgi:hypothetical protein